MDQTSGFKSSTTKMYVFALLLVGAMSLSAYLTLREVIARQELQVSVLSLSERQQMLSQRILVFVEGWIDASEDEQPRIEPQLNSLIDIFEASHKALSRGSAELGQPSDEVRNVFFGRRDHLDQDVRNVIQDLRRILSHDPNDLPERRKEILASVREACRDVMTPKFASIVALNKQASDRQIHKLYGIEFTVLLLTLALLAAEALFIFRPMTQRISHLLKVASGSWTDAVKANDVKSAFIATITHQIRTPLTSILSISESLKAENLPGHPAEQIRALNQVARSLVMLVNDLLDYSKFESGSATVEQIDFNVASIADDTFTLFHPLIKTKQMNFTFEIDAALPVILNGDPTRLRQVITNLVGNALKFTPDLGVVRVKLLQTQVGESGIMIRGEVHDTGVGIPSDLQNILFGQLEPDPSMMTQKDLVKGIGLAVSKKMIDLMGGKMGFTTSNGEGSTFWFELILRRAQKHPIALSHDIILSDTDIADIGVNLRLLLVEDNVVNREILFLQLSKMGFSVTTATNGREAVDSYSRAKFDLVIMDCEMPLMDGFDAARAIRQIEIDSKTSATTILAITAHSSDSARKKCQAAGMNDVINKPVELIALVAKIQSWLKPEETEIKIAS